jgi:hypothetical protein
MRLNEHSACKNADGHFDHAKPEGSKSLSPLNPYWATQEPSKIALFRRPVPLHLEGHVTRERPARRRHLHRPGGDTVRHSGFNDGAPWFACQPLAEVSGLCRTRDSKNSKDALGSIVVHSSSCHRVGIGTGVVPGSRRLRPAPQGATAASPTPT